MSETIAKTEEMLRRLSDVLDVLKRISEDLQDISKSLKNLSQPAIAPPVSTTVTAPPTPRPAEKHIEDVRMMFSKDLEAMLIFEDKGSFIKITPRQYLGPENFSKIASTAREAGGEYISAGKDSHFRIPKE